MKGGSHRQGSIPLALVRQKEKVKTGVEPSMFAIWKKMRTLDEPVDGSSWINEGAKIRGMKYPEKYKQVHGKDSNPDTAPFDPEVAVLAGQGQRNGRLWIADGSVNPRTVPSMRQIRHGRTSSMPAIETCPWPSVIAVDQLREEIAAERASREAAEQRQLQLEQQLSQQQAMLEQQQQMTQWMAHQMLMTAPPGSLPTPPFAFLWLANLIPPGGSNNQAPPGGSDGGSNN